MSHKSMEEVIEGCDFEYYGKSNIPKMIAKALKQSGYIHRSEVREVLEVYNHYEDYFNNRDNMIDGNKLDAINYAIKTVSERMNKEGEG